MASGMLSRLSPVVVAIVLALCAPAAALKLDANPADRMLSVAIEESGYDHATRCTKKQRPGVVALTEWLDRNARGVSWGSYRCEMWGKNQASLHAEGRALDWHLDASVPADKREAERLIALLLAPDAAGNEHALARRMGVQEIIWDCGYWGSFMEDLGPYAACFTKKGRKRRGVSASAAHRDHVHIGMTKAGAAGRTSFWTSSG